MENTQDTRRLIASRDGRISRLEGFLWQIYSHFKAKGADKKCEQIKREIQSELTLDDGQVQARELLVKFYQESVCPWCNGLTGNHERSCKVKKYFKDREKRGKEG